jgi:Zn-dependent protease
MPGALQDVNLVVAILAALVVGITVHEFSHALAAFSQGDTTARDRGRLTLNPIRHLDPVGTTMIVITALAGIRGFGWGKPTPVNGSNMRNGRASMALVSVAGVVANFVVACLIGVVLREGVLEDLVRSGALSLPNARFIATILFTVVEVNLALAVFNLIPLAPLDGFGILINLLPIGIAAKLAKYAHWGPGILMLIIFAPQFVPGLSQVNLLGSVTGPPITALERFILGA